MQVFRDRHLHQHRQFLMHDADAGAVGVGRRARPIGLPVENDLAFVGGIDAGQQVDQRRLARAVLAEQHVPLAARDVERNVAQRDDAGKALADALHRQDRIVHRAPAASDELALKDKGAGSRPRPATEPSSGQDISEVFGLDQLDRRS